MKVRRVGAVFVPMLVAATAVTSFSVPSVSQAVSTHSATSVPATLVHQTLSWSICYPGEGVPDLKCAAVRVPLDWAKPNGKTIKIEISRIKASDPAKRHGVLFTNPGGPGEPGLDLPLFIPESEQSVAAAYDLIGMDVRGVGESDPVLNCANPSILDELNNLDGRDTSRANQVKFLQLNRQYGQTCSKDPLTRYINFFQMIRDMDLVRQVLGEPKISYLGFSGGTQLGAWYASVFPQHVDRFVLDGNVDWTSPAYGSFLRQPRGFQSAFDNFLDPWIARYNRVYHLGNNSDAVIQTYEQRRAALARHPLKLADGSTLTAARYDSGITNALYVTFDYPDIATAMSTLEHYGNASRQQKEQAAEMFGGDPAAGADPFWAIECQNDRTPSWATIEADTDRLRPEDPLIGATWNVNPCPFFTTPVTGSPVQAKAIPKLLMLANSDDPATPLAGALIARSRTPNARLVTVLDEADHTIYGYGDSCADGYANRWLLHGLLPQGNPVCPGVSLPVLQSGSQTKAPSSLAPARSRPDEFQFAQRIPSRF
jgi:pimeloyl-ACP methyl ester carboxylesterase